jgi:hypothetical protein
MMYFHSLVFDINNLDYVFGFPWFQLYSLAGLSIYSVREGSFFEEPYLITYFLLPFVLNTILFYYIGVRLQRFRKSEP